VRSEETPRSAWIPSGRHTIDGQALQLKILLAINGLDFGGTESAVGQLALHLAGRGHQVRVLTMKQPGRTALRLRERGIDVMTLGMSEVVSVSSMVVAAWKMRRLLGREKVDLVQSFLPRANIVSRVANRLSGSRRPHVSSERSTDFRRSRAVRRLNRYTARWSDLVLAVSPLVRDVLVARDRIRREKIVVLENGIDLAAVDAVRARDLRREVPGLRPGRLIFCSIGRFVPEKGFLHLVRAFGRTPHREQAQVLLVGEGPEEPAVRREVGALGLEGQVVFVGFREDALGILKGADAYVLSSVEEGSPMAVLEAMACSLPVIATDVSGVSSLVGPIGPGRAAIVVPPAADWSAGLAKPPGADVTVPDGDPIARMADAMDRLVVDASLRQELGRAGRRRVEDAFTLDRIVARLEGHYASLLGAGDARG
jgi:glycosyltransferase involved in cell wall biosynthesis